MTLDGLISAAAACGASDIHLRAGHVPPFLRRAGGKVHPRVASRDAGYGFGVADVDAFIVAGARVIVTCDCGLKTPA